MEAKKSFDIQSQIRHNAEDFKNTLNDLYSWEKEIKDKEQELQKLRPHRPAPTVEEAISKMAPVRSHVVNQTTKPETTVGGTNISNMKKADVESPTEKCENQTDPNQEKRKQANLIKDRGNKNVALGFYEKAILDYTAALDVFAEDPIFYSNRALCYLKLEKYEDCIEDCERAIELDKLAVKAYYRRMQANECLGNNFDALKDCTTILTIDPKNNEAKKSLERINQRLRQSAKSSDGPNFSPLRNDMISLTPVDKPAHLRSKKPLRQIPITEVVVPKDTKNYENSNIQVSDEVIDKLFNSNCGPFKEVKKPVQSTEGTAEAKKMKKSVGKMQHVEEKIDSNKISPSKTEKPVTADLRNADIVKSSNKPLPPAPTSTAQFYSNWKELSNEQKYQYLKSIEVGKLCKILGAGFDSETLSDIILTLRDFYLPNKEPNTASTLLEVSKNNQIGILSLLMSTEDRKVISEILNAIKESTTHSPVAAMIAKNFNLL